MGTFRVAVTTEMFGEVNPEPRQMLERLGCEIVMNPYRRTLDKDETLSLLEGCQAVIAGTEQLSDDVLEHAPDLRLIARVGVGIDAVDLLSARRRKILVTYTPDAVAPAVADYTIGLMIALSRNIVTVHEGMRNGIWSRPMGRRLEDCRIGIIGVGRTGSRVIRHLATGFHCHVVAHDIKPNFALGEQYGVTWTSREKIYRTCNLISFHLPLDLDTKGMVRKEQIDAMQPGTMLINTSRGGIIDEQALYEGLASNHLGGAALDVFVQEPYRGPLAALPNCIVTSHIASCAADCRFRMEYEAAQEVARFIEGQPPVTPVPEGEYQAREN